MKEALKLALEALEYTADYDHPHYEDQLTAITAIKEALAQPDYRALQAQGKHPAPCARHCEAQAFQIVIRSLEAKLKGGNQ